MSFLRNLNTNTKLVLAVVALVAVIGSAVSAFPVVSAFLPIPRRVLSSGCIVGWNKPHPLFPWRSSV